MNSISGENVDGMDQHYPLGGWARVANGTIPGQNHIGPGLDPFLNNGSDFGPDLDFEPFC